MIMFYKEKFEKPAEESDEKQTQIRESGIELLKIFAIIVIVISHVTQTLSCENLFLPYNDYVLDVSAATTDISKFILILFRHFGVWGNAIFFVCSAWFLLGSSKYNKKKWFYMLIEVWVVSIIVLITAFIIRDGNLSGKMIIKSILPNTFANNWYITCYLLFYPVHSFLNSLIKAMNKQTLFRISAAMFMLYCCFNFVISGRFFSSPIILWITIYFIMAYLRFYMNDFSNDKKRIYFFSLLE